ncbi:Glycosyl phosphatidyl inositol protein transamidase complex subunit [Tulasnella sp. 330]|nr:Glycosyl phosphatidyl inositol protein transamidase complex subunit [Tulasnella sp. 330]
MASLLAQLRGRTQGTPVDAITPAAQNDIYAKRLARRKFLLSCLVKVLPYLITTFYLAGYAWMLMIPLRGLGENIWIDENALQPGQVTTYWDWSDVHAADNYLAQIENLYSLNATSEEKASYIQQQFASLGLKSDTQAYTFTTSANMTVGTNAYGVYPVPRASGAEAIVISASWVSRTEEGEGTPNMRGVATILALARFLSNYSLWAKDLIFVVNDGYMDGMHAWLSAYHGVGQANLEVQPLKHISGVIWTALCIDYPGHSFSHLGFFYGSSTIAHLYHRIRTAYPIAAEGLNGRLPNQDLMNSAAHIASMSGGVPITLYDTVETTGSSNVPKWLKSLPFIQDLLERHEARNYFYRASNVKRHASYAMFNRASGVHGLFHRFRIDAITLFATPSYGPYGFHSIGQIIESTLRTMNNLLERLHASFFFYVLTSVRTFVRFGGYLASAILVSVGMLFYGLRLWVVAGWEHKPFVQLVDPNVVQQLQEERKHLAGGGRRNNRWAAAALSPAWRKRDRPVLLVLWIMFGTHFVGWMVFQAVTSTWFAQLLKTILLTAFGLLIASTPLITILPSIRCHLHSYPQHSWHPTSLPYRAPTYLVLKAFNLYITSIVISITSVLNFSLAASLAIVFGVPLALTKPKSIIGYVMMIGLTPMGLVALACRSTSYGVEGTLALFARTVWEWEVLGVWFLPFACTVCLPIALQGAIVCLLPEDSL